MNLEQKIAGKARQLVEGQRQENDDKHESETAYRSLCESFPILLRTAGLVQSLAYLNSKGESESSEHAALGRHLEEQFNELGILTGKRGLFDAVTDEKINMPVYRSYSELAMKIAY